MKKHTIIALSLFISCNLQAKGMFDYLPGSKAQSQKSGTISQQEAIALYSSAQMKNSFDACVDQFPLKKPLNIAEFPSKMKPMALCSDNFAVVYSQTSKTPIVVAERINAELLADAQGEQRTNEFYADPRIPSSGRAELSDYRDAQIPVDRGHQFPAADAPTPRAMAQSFALSNMIPQDPKSNRGPWSRIESDVRKFARRTQGNVFVFTGPIFDADHKMTGKNNVWKPTRLFKLVYDEYSQRAWAYILPNAASEVSKPVDYKTFLKETNLNVLGGVPVLGATAPK